MLGIRRARGKLSALASAKVRRVLEKEEEEENECL